MLTTIALQPVPSQQVQCVLNGQNCSIAINMRGTQLYVDLSVAGLPISYGVLAHSMVGLVPNGYNGFTGQIAFLDTQASPAGSNGSDPQYTGLGSRWILFYGTLADFAALGATPNV